MDKNQSNLQQTRGKKRPGFVSVALIRAVPVAELRGVNSDEPDSVCAGGAVAVNNDRVAVDDALNGRGLPCNLLRGTVAGSRVRIVWEGE